MFIKIGIGIVSYILMIYFIIFITIKMLNFLSESFVGISLSEVCYRLAGCEPPPKKEKEPVTRNECINDLLEDSERLVEQINNEFKIKNYIRFDRPVDNIEEIMTIKKWATYPRKHSYYFPDIDRAIEFAEMLKLFEYEVEIQLTPEGDYNVVYTDKEG